MVRRTEDGEEDRGWRGGQRMMRRIEDGEEDRGW